MVQTILGSGGGIGLPLARELKREWIEMVAKELKMEPGIQVAPRFMLHIPGVFVPIMKEFPEMLYQYEQDYIFDSTKFEKRFGIFATPPEEGIRKMVESLS